MLAKCTLAGRSLSRWSLSNIALMDRGASEMGHWRERGLRWSRRWDWCEHSGPVAVGGRGRVPGLCGAQGPGARRLQGGWPLAALTLSLLSGQAPGQEVS